MNDCLHYFFPKSPCNNDMHSAKLLRKSIVILIPLHIIICVVSGAFVLFTTLLAQFYYVALLYSVYMTLRTWLLYLYMLSLALNILTGILSLFMLQGASLWAYLVIVIAYVLMFVKLNSDSKPWRNIDNPDFQHISSNVNHMVGTAREEYPNIVPSQRPA